MTKWNRIVLSRTCREKLSDFADFLAEIWGLLVVMGDSPEEDAFNLGGAEFLPAGTKVPLDSPWKAVFPTGNGYTVCGFEPVDTVNAVLEIMDCLAWKTPVVTGVRKAYLAKFDNVFDDYALGFNRTADNDNRCAVFLGVFDFTGETFIPMHNVTSYHYSA